MLCACARRRVCVCVCVHARACIHVCVHVCVCVCVWFQSDHNFFCLLSLLLFFFLMPILFKLSEVSGELPQFNRSEYSGELS